METAMSIVRTIDPIWITAIGAATRGELVGEIADLEAALVTIGGPTNLENEESKAQSCAYIRRQIEFCHELLNTPNMSAERAAEIREKLTDLDKYSPDWRSARHDNGLPVYSLDGTMLDDKGNRSIFDDVDQ